MIANENLKIPKRHLFNYNTVTFNRYVRKFYQAVVLKMMKQFPFKDTIIQDLGIIDLRKRGNVTSETVIHVYLYSFMISLIL